MPKKATISVQEVSKLLGISEATVRRYVLNGDLPGFKLGGKILILRAPLEKLLQPAA